MKKTLIALVVALATLTVGHDLLAESSDQALQHLRITWKESPQTTATISWSTPTEGKKHMVYVDTQSRKGDRSAFKDSVVAHRNGQFTAKPEENPFWYHHVVLDKLSAGETYYFVIASDDHMSKEYHFDTADSKEGPLKIICGGDSRSDQNQRKIMNGKIRDLQAGDRTVKAFAHGGDFIASGKSWSQWNRWLSDHTITTSEEGRILPIIPTRGNHDGGPMYNEVFDFPADDTNYYVTHLNDATTLITLNTQMAALGDQMVFLHESLKKNIKSKWLLAQYHRPAYPAVKGPGRSLSWAPLFEAFQMDVLVESDGHNIKRTVPIKAGKRNDEEGVVYVGEGGLGVGQRTPKTDRWYLEAPGMASRGHHVMLFTFEKDHIDYKVIMEDDSIKDSYTFKRRTRSMPARTDFQNTAGTDQTSSPSGKKK